MAKISIVVPCYNEEESVQLFYNEIIKISAELKDTEFELLFVDDGSADNTLKEIEKLAEIDDTVKYISFSRNFGKEAGIFAGLENASGDYVVLIDADLQHPPQLIIDMYKTLTTEDYDSVGAMRTSHKGESAFRGFFSKLFYKTLNKISDTKMQRGTTDYRMMNRKMLNAVLSMSEYNRFTKGIFSWVGFKTKWIEYENRERVAGNTTWSFFGLFKYSLQGIVNFSTAPLAAASFFGIALCIISMIAAAITVISTLIWGDPVAGYPTLICAILFVGGIQLLCIGIIGQYIAKLFLETKNRPKYISRKDNLNK